MPSLTRFARAVAPLLATLLSTGCAVDHGTRVSSFAYTTKEQTDGVVILSAGTQEACFGTAQQVFIQKIDDHYHLNIVGQITVNTKADKSMYPDHQGQLSVTRLPPGDYRVYQWPMGPFVPKRMNEVDFSVSAGEVVYLGEFWWEPSCSSSFDVFYRDQFDRDLALLRTLNPALAAAPIQKRILKDPKPAAVY
jgi:hypothetical protein